jgi:hypothetical protein
MYIGVISLGTITPLEGSIFGNVELRRQPKNLSKLSKIDVKPSTISHTHEDPLFLVKEESGVELSDDLLVPIVAELQQVSDAMKVTSLYNFVEVNVLLVPHVINMHPLMFDHGRCLLVEHGAVTILMKESPKSLICAPLTAVVVA